MTAARLGTLMRVRRVVDDFPGAFAFYARFRSKSGTADRQQYEEYGFARLSNAEANGLELELVARDRFDDLLGARTAEDWTLVFGVDDVDAAVADLSRAGGEVVVEPQERPDGGERFAQVRDPSGALVELSRLRGTLAHFTLEDGE
jgi:predicted enzyme related to lactoylglutathione lyase